MAKQLILPIDRVTDSLILALQAEVRAGRMTQAQAQHELRQAQGGTYTPDLGLQDYYGSVTQQGERIEVPDYGGGGLVQSDADRQRGNRTAIGGAAAAGQLLYDLFGSNRRYKSPRGGSGGSIVGNILQTNAPQRGPGGGKKAERRAARGAAESAALSRIGSGRSAILARRGGSVPSGLGPTGPRATIIGGPLGRPRPLGGTG